MTEASRVGSWHSGESALGLAGEPRLEYQPIIDLGSGQLLGFEALLRWQHPTQGIIPPNLLIPWAEANGDIVEIGAWVLAEGCRHASKWPVSLQLAVNCSIVQLRRGAASTSVRAALEASGMEPDRLTIEVTEHAMAEESAVAELRALASLGVLLAVDDVGTSWTSFDLLRRMAVNTVKIDGSFVSGLEPQHGINRMVVETVVHLAHSSGMSTVAEGVETEVTAAIVREFDSDAAQGYFFAPPLHVDVVTEMANTEGLRFPLEGPGWTDAVSLFGFGAHRPDDRAAAGRRASADELASSSAVLSTNGHRATNGHGATNGQMVTDPPVSSDDGDHEEVEGDPTDPRASGTRGETTGPTAPPRVQDPHAEDPPGPDEDSGSSPRRGAKGDRPPKQSKSGRNPAAGGPPA